MRQSSSSLVSYEDTQHGSQSTVVLKFMGQMLVWLLVFSGGFVIREPAPYEIIAFLTIVCFFFAGMPFAAGSRPMIALLFLFLIGGMGGMVMSSHLKDAAMYMAVTAFLIGTSIFFASYIPIKPEARIQRIFHAYTAGALVTGLAGIIGYFGIMYSMFTLYGRAKGFFQDPNPFGAFLILPTVIVLQDILTRPLGKSLIQLLIFMILALAVFLSFSRAAWMLLLASSLLTIFLTFITAQSVTTRFRIVAMSAIGFIALIIVLAIALSIPSIYDLFIQRFSLSQSYDSGHLGRFGRHILGFLLAFEKPFGIGPFMFAKIFPEDPHNVYLKAFMAYGWIGGLSYFALIIITITASIKSLMQPGPHRKYLIPVFSSFFLLALEGVLIDTDHWRHFYLLLGLSWGIIATPKEKWATS